MEYDKTIQHGVEPFNCMNTQRAFLFHPYEEGYFSNDLSNYADIADNLSKGNIVMGRLVGVSEESGLYRSDCGSDNGFLDFEYYLPVKFVHETENWRPFTPDEFMAAFKPGQRIYIKSLRNGICFEACYKGFFFYGDLQVGIDNMCLSLDELFNGYEIMMKDKNFVPFGVKKSEQKKTD